MRIRRVIMITLAAGALLIATSTGAGATSADGNELAECLEKASEQPTNTAVKAAVEDCNSAPNLVTPELAEIFWGGLAFLIVLVVLLKFAFPALKQAMKAREERIRSDLERAEAARTEAESELADYHRQLAEARVEAGRIIEEAREAADQVRKDLMAKADADAAEARSRAGDDIRLATERATSDLQRRVADLSIELAERVVERNLDHDTQIELIESYINQVGSR